MMEEQLAILLIGLFVLCAGAFFVSMYATHCANKAQENAIEIESRLQDQIQELKSDIFG